MSTGSASCLALGADTKNRAEQIAEMQAMLSRLTDAEKAQPIAR
jgi:hypothetical protein